MEAAKKKRMPIEEPGGDEGEEETEESQTESDDGRREERSERTKENERNEVRKGMREVIPPFLAWNATMHERRVFQIEFY